MRRLLALPILAAVLAAGAALPAAPAAAHCQVPCGIFADELKLDQLAQDVETITKAAAQIRSLAGSDDADDHQQLTRWVVTKEEHAAGLMEEMLTYFLAQRIKLPADDATDEQRSEHADLLAAAHSVIVHAMKTKQTADPAAGEALGQALSAFRTLYLGDHHH